MTHVGIQRLAAGQGQENGSERDERDRRADRRADRAEQRDGLVEGAELQVATLRRVWTFARPYRVKIASFLGGARPVEVIAPPAQKAWDLKVVVPVEDMAAIGEQTGDITSGSASGVGK